MNKATTISIDQADLKAKMAIYNERTGDLDKAEAFASKALELDPENANARLVMARICRRREDFPQARKLLAALIKELPQKHELRATLHFEIAEVYDRTGHYRQALIDWTRGNHLQVSRPEYKQIDHEEFLQQIDDLGKRDYHALNNLSAPDQIPSPVFMVGFPRSGTTLLHHMLDDHPDVQVLEEISVLLNLARGISDYPASLHATDQQQVNRWRETYWREVAEHLELGKGLVIDKLPLSLIHIPLIKLLFPKAKIVLSLRHPCDCVLSNFTQLYSLNNAMKNFSTLAGAVHAYVKVMSLWNHYRSQLDLDCHEVFYERLIEDVASEQHRLLEFLELEPVETILRHQSSAQNRFVSTPSYYDVSQPIFTRSIGRWRNYSKLLDWPPGELRPFIKQFSYDG